MNFIPTPVDISQAQPIAIEKTLSARFVSPDRTNLAARKILHQEGDAATHTWEIISGHMILTMDMDGKLPTVVGILHPGDIVGLVQDGRYFATAKTLSAVQLRKIALRDTGERISQRINDQLCRAMQQHMRVAALESLQRLAAFFLDWARSTGIVDDDLTDNGPVDLFIPIQRAELASYLAMVGESMSRNLARLRALKIIETPEISTIRILDFSRLIVLARGTA